jgi:hypothetical protein
MKLKEQFFDFEVYPEWWCCVIGKYPDDDNIPESIKDDFIVVTSDDASARETLLNIVCNPEYCNFGYNNKRYDNIILNGVANGFTPRQIKILSDIIINPEVQYESQEAMRIAPFAKKRYQNFIYQDMFDDNSGSLKEKEACMQLDIRESTVPFDKVDLTDEDKLDIISYCKHDVWSGMQFYKRVLKSFIDTKLLVGKTFNIPMDVCYKSTNANLSAKVLGARRTSFPDSNRQDIEIPKELQSYIRYSLPANIVDRLCASPEKFDVKLFGNTVSYSNGGIHSIPCKNLQVKANDEWALMNVDAASFYPAIMIFHNLLSRAVTKPELFKEMYLARLEFKKFIEPFENKWRGKYEEAPREEYEHYKYCKDTSQAYKLILNTTYGASGNEWLDLYDPYMTTSTCRVGQLLITSLANNVYNQIGKDKVQIVQSNTDGILFYIRRDMIDMLMAICDEFTRVTQILLEAEHEEITWQRDVNNYILYKMNGKEKSKGGFFVTDMIQPGYNRVRPLDAYVCRDAVKNWLKYGKDIVDHIYNETDISKFVITCHKGSFSGIVREFNDGRPDQILHNVNRVYASTDTSLGMIKKTKKIKGELKKYKAPGCPPHCELINEDLSKYRVEDMQDKIDYMWYIENTVNLLSDQWYEMQGPNIVPIKIFSLD